MRRVAAGTRATDSSRPLPNSAGTARSLRSSRAARPDAADSLAAGASICVRAERHLGTNGLSWPTAALKPFRPPRLPNHVPHRPVETVADPLGVHSRRPGPKPPAPFGSERAEESDRSHPRPTVRSGRAAPDADRSSTDPTRVSAGQRPLDAGHASNLEHVYRVGSRCSGGRSAQDMPTSRAMRTAMSWEEALDKLWRPQVLNVRKAQAHQLCA
jgi:hypothetical protein